jgi:hypothetical protein
MATDFATYLLYIQRDDRRGRGTGEKGKGLASEALL